MWIGPTEAISVAGPWTHRYVAAHGARFHVVEAGSGPLVLLLHGFPTFWWTWRHQITALADAGFHAVAMDLRGYGGSDHTPHGYDPESLAGDAAAVIRSLGQSEAVVIGHGWGGYVAWSMGVYESDVTRAIAAIGAPHPRALTAGIRRSRRQRAALRYALAYQLPLIPERRLVRNEAARIGSLLERWSASPNWPDDEVSARYRGAFALWPTAHTAIEYHRWAIRSVLRRDGRRFAERMRFPISAPVLQVHGSADPAILLDSVAGSQEYVTGSYEIEVLDGVGHFPHEEAPDATTSALLAWLRTLP